MTRVHSTVLIPVPSSSCVQAIGYDEIHLTMYAQFKPNVDVVYGYSPVTRDLWEWLAGSSSKGKALRQIKANRSIRCSRVSQSEVRFT